MATLRDIYKKNLDDYNDKINNRPSSFPLFLLGCFIIAGGLWRRYYVHDDSDIISIILIIFGFMMIFFTLLRALVAKDIIRDNISQFICPNCLKSVLLDKLTFQCPFCNEKYGEFAEAIYEQSKDDLSGNIVQNFVSGFDVANKEKILFDECKKCESKIQYVQCYHCQKPINLFAPYNQEELEAKRYD